MNKAMLIAKENTPNENILSNSYRPAMDKNGLRSLQIPSCFSGPYADC